MKKIIAYIYILCLIILLSCFLFEKKGTISFQLTDAPAIILEDGKTVKSILVTITEIKISKGDSNEEIPEGIDIEITGEETDTTTDDTAEWITISSEEQEFNLLELQNGVTAPLGLTQLEAGHYNQIRIIVAENNFITFFDDTNIYDLKIPGDTKSGVKLVGGFFIQADQETEIIIDFDARLSVHAANGQYILRPTMKIIKLNQNQKD